MGGEVRGPGRGGRHGDPEVPCASDLLTKSPPQRTRWTRSIRELLCVLRGGELQHVPQYRRVATTAPSAPSLVRAIGLRDATFLVITNVIGSAIFLTPGTMAATLPSESLLLLAWIAGGVIALCGGLTYAEMGAMFPRSGGLYVFLEEAYGPLVAFLFGWAGILVILTGSVATVAVGFAKYFSYFVPALGTDRVVLSMPMPWGVWAISAAQIVAAAS